MQNVGNSCFFPSCPMAFYASHLGAAMNGADVLITMPLKNVFSEQNLFDAVRGKDPLQGMLYKMPCDAAENNLSVFVLEDGGKQSLHIDLDSKPYPKVSLFGDFFIPGTNRSQFSQSLLLPGYQLAQGDQSGAYFLKWKNSDETRLIESAQISGRVLHNSGLLAAASGSLISDHLESIYQSLINQVISGCSFKRNQSSLGALSMSFIRTASEDSIYQELELLEKRFGIKFPVDDIRTVFEMDAKYYPQLKNLAAWRDIKRELSHIVFREMVRRRACIEFSFYSNKPNYVGVALHTGGYVGRGFEIDRAKINELRKYLVEKNYYVRTEDQ
jgi:hypothetical protein